MNETDIFDEWEAEILNGVRPTMYRLSEGSLSKIAIGPGLVTVIGAPPGGSKTALVTQLCIDALRVNPDLKAAVCNTEMPAQQLLNRQLSRLSGIDLDIIMERNKDEYHHEALRDGLDTLRELKPRLHFVRKAFSIEQVVDEAKDFGAKLLILDHLQAIARRGPHSNTLEGLEATMDAIRDAAMQAMAIIVVSEVTRPRDRSGRADYGNALSMASYKGAAEIEYGADDCYMLSCKGDIATLRHLKSRYGRPQDIVVRFDGAVQRFTDPPISEAA